MINALSSADSAATDYTSSTATAKKDSAVNKEMFMQLLVAQVKNQNPLSPTDGVQFLTQLAQFSELEQMAEIRNEIVSLRTDMNEKTAEPPAGTQATGEANV
jgi:flagellar basal-body rod modification protein FlgD